MLWMTRHLIVPRSQLFSVWKKNKDDVFVFLHSPSHSDHRNSLRFSQWAATLLRAHSLTLCRVVVTRTEYTQPAEALICWYAGPATASFHGTKGFSIHPCDHSDHSVKACLKATLPCVHRRRADLLSLVNTATSQQLLIFTLSHFRVSFSALVETETNSTFACTKAQPVCFKHEWALVQMSVNRLTTETLWWDKAQRRTRGSWQKTTEQLKGIQWEVLSSMRGWLYAWCLDGG